MRVALRGLALSGLLWCGCARAPEIALPTLEIPPVSDQAAAAAIAAARQRAEDHPDSAEAWGELAEVLHAHDLFEPAGVAYQHAALLDPERADWPYLAGHALLQVGDVGAAAAQLLRAAELAPSDPLALAAASRAATLAGDLETARTLAERAVAVAPDLAIAQVALGEALQALGAELDAAQAFARALTLQPEATRLHRQLAPLLRRLGRSAEAERAATLSGDQPVTVVDERLARVAGRRRGLDALLEKAKQAFAGGDIATAETSYRAATLSHPGSTAAWIGLGSALIRLGDQASGRAAFEKALELGPREPLAHYNLGVIAAQSGDDDGAIHHATVALEIDPNLHDARFNLANALRRRGQHLEAAAHYRIIVAAQPTRGPAWQALAAALASADDWRAALASVERGLAAAPGSGDLHIARVRILATAPDPAIRDGQAALALATRLREIATTPLILEAAALAAAELGQWRDAQSLLDQALAAPGYDRLDARVRERLRHHREQVSRDIRPAGVALD